MTEDTKTHRSACVQGVGFRNETGGFSYLLVNGRRVTPERIVAALAMAERAKSSPALNEGGEG